MEQKEFLQNEQCSKPVNTRSKLDLQKLENKLVQELNNDKIYWLQNETKINAVTTAPTYHDFRQRVLASHLQPMNKKDKETISSGAGINSKVIWNTSVTKDSKE